MSKKSVKKVLQKRFIIVGGLVLALVISFIGGSYSWLNSQAVSGEYNYFEEDNFELSYSRSDSGYSEVLTLKNESPISDKKGSAKDAYRFSITNIGDKENYYKLRISLDDAFIEADNCNDKILSTNYIKYKIDNEEPKILGLLADKDYQIYVSKQSLMPGTSEIHELRIWIDENSPSVVSSKHFHGVIKVETFDKNENYKEFVEGQKVSLLNGQEYYVLNNSDSSSSKVTLISKYNVSKVGLQDEKCDTDNCTMTYSEAISIINGRFLNELKVTLKGQKTKIDNIEVRLLNKNEINENMSWLLSNNMWTESEETKNETYILNTDGINYNFLLVNNNEKYGLKPVIVIEKENII